MFTNLKENDNFRASNMQKLLENPEEQKLVDLAALISPNNVFEEDKELLGVKIIKDDLKSNFNTAFTLDEIYAECRKYNLAFNSSRYYKGEFSISFLKKIQEFIKEKKLAVSPDDYSRCLYILTPSVGDCGKGIDADIFKEIKYPVKDPLMFWRVEKNDKPYFILIDGQKNYISLWNLIKGFREYSVLQMRIYYFVQGLIIYTFVQKLIIHLFELDCLESIWGYFLIILFAFIHRIILALMRNSCDKEGDQMKSYFNKYKYPKL